MKMAKPTIDVLTRNAIASLKEAEDLARHKDQPLTQDDLDIIGEACEDAIIAIRLLMQERTASGRKGV